jgi:crotonobetainyl-CoA:carnitine CoA-transferase CaiB-like acyl-CoA transferase
MTEATGPLLGVKVLDLSIALTGPYAAALLADQGAEIVKVERPGIGDIARWVGVAVNGMSAFYLACNRGKRCIAVDLSTDEGRDIVFQMAADADVIIQNFRPGVIDRLGLGYDAVRERNPDVIYASISGYGPVGPYRDRSAYDTSIQAYAGFAATQAEPDGPPTFIKQNAADKVSALFACQAITAALFARASGRGGQHLELGMADACVSFLWAEAAGNEVLLGADGSRCSRLG